MLPACTPPSTWMRADEPALVDRSAQPPDLVEGRGQEALPREAGVDAHDQHVVELGQDLLEQPDRGRRVERHAGPDAPAAQVRDSPLQVRHGLDVHADGGGARVDEGVEVAIGGLDHQVDVDRERRRAPDGFDDDGTERDVRHEAPVHHVDVHEPGTAALDGLHGVGEMGEVGGEHRGSEDHEASRLTSRTSGVRALDAVAGRQASGAARCRAPRRGSCGSARRRP